MTGVWASSSVSICPATDRWVDRSIAAMYWAASLSYCAFAKWAAFQEPVPDLAVIVSSGAVRNTLGTERCPESTRDIGATSQSEFADVALPQYPEELSTFTLIFTPMAPAARSAL